MGKGFAGKRKIGIVLAVIFIYTAMVSVLAADAGIYDNVIKDYECTYKDNRWGTSLNKSTDNTMYHSGDCSLLLSATADKPLNSFDTIFDSQFGNFPIENGQSYYYSFWIKISNPSLSSYGLYTPYYYQKADTSVGFSSPYYHTKSFQNTSDWQYVTGSFTANLSDYAGNAGATPLELYFRIVAWGTGGSQITDENIWLDQVSLRKIPAADVNKISLSGMKRIVNDSDGSLNNGVTLTFDSTNVDTDNLANISVTENGSVISGYTLSSTKDEFNNETCVSVIFNTPVDASSLTSFQVSGLMDVWGREISVSAAGGGYNNLISDYECANIGSWHTEINKSIDSATYHSGGNALKLSASGDKPMNSFGTLVENSFYNSFPIENGQSYHYSFWMKMTNTSLRSYGLYTRYYYQRAGESSPSYSVSYYHTKGIAQTTDWQYVTGSFTANLSDYASNTGATPLELDITLVAWDTSGSSLTDETVWIDQFSMRKVPAAEDIAKLYGMKRIVNENDSSLNDGVEVVLNSTDIDTDNLSNFAAAVNGNPITNYTLSSKKDVINNETVLYVVFESPISASSLSSFDVSGIYDLWGREIVIPAGDGLSITSTYFYKENDVWYPVTSFDELSGKENCSIKSVTSISNCKLPVYTVKTLSACYDNSIVKTVNMSDAAEITSGERKTMINEFTVPSISGNTAAKTFVWNWPSIAPLTGVSIQN